MKIVIVMTYFNRLPLLEHTLKSIYKTKHKDFEIVIVDDRSDEIVDFSVYGRRIHTYRVGDEKWWTNPVIAYNLGIHEAMKYNPDAIILQNAECYHFGDILKYTSENLTNDNYLSFSALALDQDNTAKGISDKMIRLLLPIEYSYPNNPDVPGLGWYNHPTLIPRAYDFCAAVTRENIIKLNGYDERFAKFVAYGDNDLILRVRRMGLNVRIPLDPFVVHQWHEHSHIDVTTMGDMGLSLYQNIEAKETGYKARHTHTRDLCEYL